MAYCTLANVETMMGISFTPTSRPTVEEAEDIVDSKAAEIDGVAQASGYTVPLTGTAAIAMLKHYNAIGAACACWHAGFISDTAPARVEYWCQEFRDFIARLRRGEQQIPSEDPTSDLDPVFGIVQQPSRDSYFTGQDEGLE